MTVESARHHLLIVEDSGFIADALRHLVQLLPDVELAGCAGSYAEVITYTSIAVPTIVSLDLRIPSTPQGVSHSDNGMATLQYLHRLQPTPRILVVTSLPEMPWLQATKQAGAVGFISKEASSDTLLAALQALIAGFSAFTPAQLQLLEKRSLQTAAPISAREAEVLRLLAEGLSNQAIAAQLHISIGTVRKHVENLYSTLHVRSRGEAVATARRIGLL